MLLVAARQRSVRLMLSAPQRPWQDAVLDYLVSITGEGLEAEAVVTSLEGDSLDAYFSDLAERFRGWEGVREWRSLEGQLRIVAKWSSRGHVTLRVHLRSTHHRDVWETSAEFDVEAGAEMDALSTEVAQFFAASR
nr:DUF6228 family protein [Kribbella amoyensis]